jgi:uncharacterized protein
MRRIVLDTNVLLISISERSRIHWVFRELIRGAYTLCVTMEMLLEYAEIIGQHMGEAYVSQAMNMLIRLRNVELTTTYYRFNLLRDPDDNKFVDCAIAARADLLVTYDRDFDALREVPFPTVPFGDITALAALLGR